GVRALRVREVGGLLVVALEPVDVAVDLAARREDDRDVPLPRVLEDVERHHRVLERSVRLTHELMHLGVRGEMHDEVGLRVLDAVDPPRVRRVVAGEVLEQVREGVRPRVEALVDPEDLMPALEQPEREVRADLSGGAGDEDAHRAETLQAWSARSQASGTIRGAFDLEPAPPQTPDQRKGGSRQPCSSDSRNGQGKWSSSRRTRRELSSTTTSARSTSCLACCARRRASPRGCSSSSTSPWKRCAPRSPGSSARATRSRPARSRSRRARRRCSSSRCARRSRWATTTSAPSTSSWDSCARTRESPPGSCSTSTPTPRRSATRSSACSPAPAAASPGSPAARRRERRRRT